MENIIDEQNMMTKIASNRYLESPCTWINEIHINLGGETYTIWKLIYNNQREIKQNHYRLPKIDLGPVRYKTEESAYKNWVTNRENNGGLKRAVKYVALLRQHYRQILPSIKSYLFKGLALYRALEGYYEFKTLFYKKAKGGLRSIFVSDKFLNIIFNLTCSKSKFLDFIHYLEGSDSLRVG